MQQDIPEKPFVPLSSGGIFYSIFDPPEQDPPRTSLLDPVPKKFDCSSLGPVIFSSKLSKKAKKIGFTITRHFFLFSTHLAYGSSENTYKVKKFTELKGLKVSIIINEAQTPKNPTKYMMIFFRSKVVLKLYATSLDLLEKWRTHLMKYCIMTNFVDNYTVSEVLGRGAHGKVVLATNNQDGKKYAVKIFEKIQLITRLKGFDCVANELETLRKLDHKGIIRLHEVIESVGSIYLVLDYVEGGELYTRIKQKKVFPEHEIIVLLKNILEALVYLHGKSIIHRDIKPENIVLMSHDNNTDIRLVDFGFALNLAGSYDNKRCGTPGYVSPEILCPKPWVPVTGKVDIFGVGAIFYQLLTGSKLFSGDNVETIIRKNKECRVDTFKLDARKISPAARDLLFKMLAKDPSNRISASEALDHHFLKSVTVSTTDIPDDLEDTSIGETSRYSFDMTHLKELNMCSRSKVFDSAGTFHIISHIPMDRVQGDDRPYSGHDQKPYINFHNYDASPKSIYSNPNSHFTSESSFDSMEEGKDDRIASPRSGLGLSVITLHKAKKSMGSNTPTTSPFHKAAIMNNLKKSQMFGLKPQEISPTNSDYGVSGGFADYLNKVSEPDRKISSGNKRNSII